MSIESLLSPCAKPELAAVKLYPDKLESHLKQKTLPIYLLHGDEPLQLMRVGDRLRQHARDTGHDEREVMFMLDDSDWAQLRESTASMSLFAERRLIEVRLPSGKPGRAGAEVLKQYAADPAPDVLLLIHSARLERAATSSAWFKAIDKVGATLTAFAPAARELPRWLEQEMGFYALTATPEALEMLAERIEGNLLAGAQEVQRLSLLYPQQTITADIVLAAVADSARFAVSDLTAAMLRGEPRRALRVLRGLFEERVAEVLILYMLTQEVRAGTRVAESVRAGVSVDRAMKAAGVWPQRIEPLKHALARHPEPDDWLEMLTECSRLDRMIKGRERGSVHDTMADLVLRLAGPGIPVMPELLLH